MAPKFVNQANKEADLSTSDSLSFTPGAGVNLVIGVLLFRGSVTGVSVNYGGLGMTLLDVSTNNWQLYAYYLLNPPANAALFAASWTGSVAHGMAVCGYKEVNTAIPFGAVVKPNSLSMSIPSGPDELPIGFITSNGSITGSGAGQTRDFTLSGAFHNGAGDHQVGASPTATISWTTGGGAFAVLGVSLKPQSSFFLMF